jgi:hypothetical protein
MAHFAWLDNNNVVYQVSTVDNENIGNLPFPDSEPVGIAYLTSVYGETLNWKQTSYNANFRGLYAGIGFTYDPTIDEFVAPPGPDETE